jgi:hypothetical protein
LAEQDGDVDGNVRLQCPSCDTYIIVMPSELYTAVGDLAGIEGEVQFSEVVKGDKALTGDRLAVADVDRSYTCPVCGDRGQLPPEDELPTNG